jgi:uridine monophosphate synthetase
MCLVSVCPRRLSYEERAAVAKNSVAKQCFEIMARKRTNLAVAADVATADEMLALAEQTGPHICVFKTHVDIFDRCGMWRLCCCSCDCIESV